MLDLTRIDSAIVAGKAKTAKEALNIGKCFNRDLMIWILEEVKEIIFRPDGTRRSSFLIGKGRLILFVIRLAAKVADCLLDNKPTDPGSQITH